MSCTPNEDLPESRRNQIPGHQVDPMNEGIIPLTLENQSLKQQIETQTQLMHLLTHQLATPLTALNGSMHLLAEPYLTVDQRREFLAVVQQQVHRLQELLHDLIALRDLDTGVLETNIVCFCLMDLVQDVMQGMTPHPATYVWSSNLPHVWGDRWQISQILVNLLSNAIKYSPDGRPIEIGATLLQTGWVEVWVRDQGLGIPEADQPHLFERFFRVRHRDRQHIDGSGLGLSLCKLLVENQGGQMGFESTHGQGSRFYFTLPTAEAMHR
jgi:signal transduction histidine kinase